ncbi:Cytochrome P450 2U1 [Hypsibius exemplaris]|uniref:Cytochrome P450 2U1 n=1 Tax=Hypsibius exemplaris TaxID=2072580 RepID=A0A9X6NEK5_HYPEX|nr:Cytochrome P450 2U1 [Hypsibius exemplaris]
MDLAWDPLIPILIPILLCSLVYFWRKNRDLPPGPNGIPFLGYVPVFLTSQPQDTLMELGKRYGNVFSFYMGKRLVVVLNDYAAIKAAYTDQAEIFSGRAGGFISRYIRLGSEGKAHGFGAPQGTIWKEGRKFMLQTFRDLGMGKSKLQGSIIDEADRIVRLFTESHGQSFDPFPFLYAGAANLIGSLCYGETLDHTEPSFKQTLASLSVTNAYTAHMEPLQTFQFLRYVPGQFRERWRAVVESRRQILKFLGDKITEHRKTYFENEIRDYIDAFFHEQARKKISESEVFRDEELLQNLRGFFSAGTDTTSKTLQWALLFLLHHPEVQERIHQELDRGIEAGQRVILADRTKLPYLEAVIREVQRFANLVPLGLPRANVTETILLGHRIPVNSVIIPSFKSVNEDPALWEDPMTFDPTRFLDKNGNVHEAPHFIPFSIGKRDCVGASLARMELFLLFANIMQRLVIKPPTDSNLPSTTDRITYLTSSPRPFKVRAILRNQKD